jgi:hypothetical protein
MWRVHKAAGREWPTLCEDDVIDYMVMEAVFMKVQAEDAAAEKKAQVAQEKTKVDHLKALAEG